MSLVKQASLETQLDNVALNSKEPSYVELHTGKKVRIDYLYPDTQDKINYLNLQYEKFKKEHDEDDPDYTKRTRQHFAQFAAAVMINNYFGLKLWWWAKWRLLYHFGKLNGDDCFKISVEAKKKAQEQQYYMAMALMMGMTTTWTMMTSKEAEEYHHELSLAKEAQSLKSTQA